MENYPLYKGRIYESEVFLYSEFLKRWYMEYEEMKYFDKQLPSEFVNKIAPPIPKGQIAIGRDSVLCLNENGTPVPLIDGQENCFSKEQVKFVEIASTGNGYIGLTENGRAIIKASSREYCDYCDLDCYPDVKDVIACEGHMAILFIDGKVMCYDFPDWCESPNHNSVVNGWYDIKQVAMGYYNIMGLKTDGTVLYHREHEEPYTNFYEHCKNVIQIDCTSVYYGCDYSAVLHADGTITSDSFDGVSEWSDIVQIAVNERFIAGLKSDGTVVAIENGKDVSDQIGWTDIVNIECKFFFLIGITKDGHVKSIMLRC